jgi:hypothetical protein
VVQWNHRRIQTSCGAGAAIHLLRPRSALRS